MGSLLGSVAGLVVLARQLDAGSATGLLATVSIAFGLVLMFNPRTDAQVLPMVVGALGLAGGIVGAMSSIASPLLPQSSSR